MHACCLTRERERGNGWWWGRLNYRTNIKKQRKEENCCEKTRANDKLPLQFNDKINCSFNGAHSSNHNRQCVFMFDRGERLEISDNEMWNLRSNISSSRSNLSLVCWGERERETPAINAVRPARGKSVDRAFINKKRNIQWLKYSSLDRYFSEFFIRLLLQSFRFTYQIIIVIAPQSSERATADDRNEDLNQLIRYILDFFPLLRALSDRALGPIYIVYSIHNTQHIAPESSLEEWNWCSLVSTLMGYSERSRSRLGLVNLETLWLYDFSLSLHIFRLKFSSSKRRGEMKIFNLLSCLSSEDIVWFNIITTHYSTSTDKRDETITTWFRLDSRRRHSVHFTVNMCVCTRSDTLSLSYLRHSRLTDIVVA